MNQYQDSEQDACFIAAKWEKGIAAQFLQWVTTSDEARNRAFTLGKAIEGVWHQHADEALNGELARKLPEVLRGCDTLTFSQPVEAVAYAGLHLLDRYGRVTQILEHLLQEGILPLRKNRVSVLEVGSGPAPALYAARDFYAMLKQWAAQSDVKVADVGVADSLERGTAWDRTLHSLSEQLILTRGQDSNIGALPFRRTIEDLTGFNARSRHHAAVAQRTRSIIYEFDSADEYISPAAASMMAYAEGVPEPSAYDLIFMCNFLTQERMTQEYERELLTLTKSLTPGGVLIVMGGVNNQYPAIYECIRRIANESRLSDISPREAFDPNLSLRLDLVRDHVRANVAAALSACDPVTAASVESGLPKDLLDLAEEFKLPKYRALVFGNKRARHH